MKLQRAEIWDATKRRLRDRERDRAKETRQGEAASKPRRHSFRRRVSTPLTTSAESKSGEEAKPSHPPLLLLHDFALPWGCCGRDFLARTGRPGGEPTSRVFYPDDGELLKGGT